MTDPLISQQAERAVAAACLLSHQAALRLVVDEQIHEDMLAADQQARHVIAAVRTLAASNAHIDTATVLEQLRAHGTLTALGDERGLDQLAAEMPAVGALGQLAGVVRDLHVRRTRLQLLRDAAQVVRAGDEQAWADLMARMDDAQTHVGRRNRTFGTEDVANVLLDSLQTTTKVERLPWPLAGLNDLAGGGARPGQVIVISGPSNHGKSAFADQTLEAMVERTDAPRRRARLYLNEMTVQERSVRIAARRSGLPKRMIEQWEGGFGSPSDKQWQRLMGAMAEQPIEITECDGWTAEDICRDARRNPVDVICVDIVQRLPRVHERRVEDMEQASNLFDRLAKDLRCVVILVAHVNRGRVRQDGTYDVPSRTDLKDADALGQDADDVVFVWREQDRDTKKPLDDGLVFFAKGRGHELGGVHVVFDGERQKFVQDGTTMEAAA